MDGAERLLIVGALEYLSLPAGSPEAANGRGNYRLRLKEPKPPTDNIPEYTGIARELMAECATM